MISSAEDTQSWGSGLEISQRLPKRTFLMALAANLVFSILPRDRAKVPHLHMVPGNGLKLSVIKPSFVLYIKEIFILHIINRS